MESIWGLSSFYKYSWHDFWNGFLFFWELFVIFPSFNSSELAQRCAINEIAESMMAFNTNYKDTGLFGVYAVAKVEISAYKHDPFCVCVCDLIQCY